MYMIVPLIVIVAIVYVVYETIRTDKILEDYKEED